MLGALIVGAIVGIAAGTTGMVNSVLNDTKAFNDAVAQQKYIDELYKLQKEREEEEFRAAKEEAEKNAELARQQADLVDLGQDIAEQRASIDFNTAIDNMYLSQATDAVEWNSQAMLSGKQEGETLSNLAGSGVRAGSSLSDAVLLESAVNENQLQFTQDAKRKSDNNNLAAVLNNLAGVKYDIMGNRIGADVTRQKALDLVNSYLEGGVNYNLYQNTLEQLKTKHSYDYEQLEKEKDQHSGGNVLWHAASSFLTFGASGFKTGYNTATTISEAGKYKTTV